jgi:hypothetical protein
MSNDLINGMIATLQQLKATATGIADTALQMKITARLQALIQTLRMIETPEPQTSSSSSSSSSTAPTPTLAATAGADVKKGCRGCTRTQNGGAQ